MDPSRILGTLWGAWMVSWLLAAIWSARTVARQPAGARVAHILLVLAGAALLFSRLGRSGLFSLALIPTSPVIARIGIGLTFLGLAFTWWARIHLGRNWSGT